MTSFYEQVFKPEHTPEHVSVPIEREEQPRRLQMERPDPMLIYLETKSVYGRYLYYPNCDKSGSLIKILGDKKSFTEDQIKALHESGFNIRLSFPKMKGEITYSPSD